MSAFIPKRPCTRSKIVEEGLTVRRKNLNKRDDETNITRRGSHQGQESGRVGG